MEDNLTGNKKIAKKLVGMNAYEQRLIDEEMIKLDDTLIDSFNYIHCRNCFAFLAKESKILYNN